MGMRAEVMTPVEDGICIKCGDATTTSSAYLHVVHTQRSSAQEVELEFRSRCLACWTNEDKRPELCSYRGCTELKVVFKSKCEFHAG